MIAKKNIHRPQADFNMFIVLNKDIPYDWFIKGLFIRTENKRGELNIDYSKQAYLLGCYKAYADDMSNGDILLRLYFKKQTEEDRKVFSETLKEWDKLGIGYISYKFI